MGTLNNVIKVRLTESESRTVLARGWEGENGEKLSQGYKLSSVR